MSLNKEIKETKKNKQTKKKNFAQSAGAVEYTDCFSAERGDEKKKKRISEKSMNVH